MSSDTPPILHVCLSPMGDGRLTCPRCHYSAHGQLAACDSTHPVLKVQCRCGEKFAVLLQQPASIRQRTWLPGQYTALASQRAGQLVIVALSCAGLRFATQASHRLHVGDVLDVHFAWEHMPQPLLTKRVRVCWVSGPIIEADWCAHPAAEGEFGFALLPS